MNTQIGQNIEEACRWLDAGEVIGFPTETVYGLAGNALNEDAVLRIFQAKGRPRFNPLIIHLPYWEASLPYIKAWPDTAIRLAEAFCPGPITFLLPRTSLIPDLVTAGSEKVAVRFPRHPLAQSLLAAIPYPLAAPSANRSGYVSPVTAQHVYDGLHGRIPYILDGGPCQVGLESTIVDFEEGKVILRRSGGLTTEEIEAVCGHKVLLQTDAIHHPVAPGQLKSHYATETPLYFGELAELKNRIPVANAVILGWGTPQEIAAETGLSTLQDALAILSLSVSKSLDEAAKNLFATMRSADAMHAGAILVSRFPGRGMGQAINDRLQRAEHHHQPEQAGNTP